MAVVLGIDAAWTKENPAGVALVKKHNDTWNCIAIAPSYESFITIATDNKVDWDNPLFNASPLNVAELVKAAEKIAGTDVDLVSIDMPISKVKITGRRKADDQVSQVFGRHQAAVYTPTKDRPGKLGESMTQGFRDCGFEVCTKNGISKPLLEVYPHAALINLLQLTLRLKYKVSKSTRYWPRVSKEMRIDYLLQNMRAAHDGLSKFVRPASPHGQIVFPEKPAKLSILKSYEDALDALVCAWVGMCHLEGKTECYGDNEAAIWVPSNDMSAPTRDVTIKD